ncbi:MAG: YaeQ family protein [Gammaproteobacteria bacterium]|nr:YaeQ family protein [Gammaproteobacteria bacterium]
MALKSTIYKASISITDMDRNYYQSHTLTLARHPSETDERMMIRLLAYVINASDTLAFSKGLSSNDEPDLWQKDLTGKIELWIETGQPDEKSIRKACGLAQKVAIYTYSGHSATLWYEQIKTALSGINKLTVVNIPQHTSHELAKLADRNMQLQCTIQDGYIWLSNDLVSVEIKPQICKPLNNE